MSKHPSNLNRLHSKLLARYGVDDELVVQLKTEIDLQKNLSVMDIRWSVSYGEFIKGVFPSAQQLHYRPDLISI